MIYTQAFVKLDILNHQSRHQQLMALDWPRSESPLGQPPAYPLNTALVTRFKKVGCVDLVRHGEFHFTH